MEEGIKKDLSLLEHRRFAPTQNCCRTCGLIGHDKASSGHCLAHFAFKMIEDRRKLNLLPTDECKQKCNELIDQFDAITTGKTCNLKWQFSKGSVKIDQLRKASMRAFK